ncbi:alpha/beta hydrolase [Nonomuraea sp. NPDC002799]
MPFNPYLAEKLHLLQGITWSDADSDPAAAERLAGYFEDPAPWTLPEVTVEDLRIDGPHGPIPIRTYRPRGTPGSALLWAHGGGFSAGDLDMPEAHVVSAELAARAGAFVVSVGYRLAVNGVRYPVPLDDVEAAWHWLTGENAPGGPDTSGGAATSGGAIASSGAAAIASSGTAVSRDAIASGRVAMGGASAGAALALAAALRNRDRGHRAADLLLLAYPFAHFPNPALDDATAAEMVALPATMRFPVASIEDMVGNYVGRISDLPPDALPGAARLGGLPATRLVLSEYDDLRPSGELLERQLREAGVPVEAYLAKGMPHGHLNRTPSLEEVDASLDQLAAALRALT